MKKRFTFITLILALVAVFVFSLSLILSSNKSTKLLMEETTEIDDDTFGELTMFDENNEIKLLEGEPDAPRAPRIGYQTHITTVDEKKYISIRFAAAIADFTNVAGTTLTATWTRQLVTYDGTAVDNEKVGSSTHTLGTPTDFESKTAYLNLITDSTPVAATSVPVDDTEANKDNKPFKYFVVYTLKNIPVNNDEPFKLKAKLTLTSTNSNGSTSTDTEYKQAIASETYKIYLDPNSWITKGDDNKYPRYTVASFNSKDVCTWIDMSRNATNGLFEAEIPASNQKIVFCRMKASDSTNSFETSAKYNQTGDLQIGDNINKAYKILNWNGNYGNSGGDWQNYNLSTLKLIMVDASYYDVGLNCKVVFHSWNSSGDVNKWYDTNMEQQYFTVDSDSSILGFEVQRRADDGMTIYNKTYVKTINTSQILKITGYTSDKIDGAGAMSSDWFDWE